MTVSYLRIRWLTVLTILGIAVVLSACSDSSAPTPEPTATALVPTNTPASAPTRTVESTPTSAQSPINAFASVSAELVSEVSAPLSAAKWCDDRRNKT